MYENPRVDDWRPYVFDEPQPARPRIRALITGAGGFVGTHLWHHLLEEGDDVWGIVRSSKARTQSSDVRTVYADLRDGAELRRVIHDVEPDAIYHLAAQSSTAESITKPWETLRNNLEAQNNLFEAILAARRLPRVLVVGSSDEYGRVDAEHLPTDEDAPLRPITSYAVSKVGQDMMGFQYFAQHGLPVVRVRPFSHTGPGHDARFVIPSFARQLAEIELGLRTPMLCVGNLNVWRDFTDVRDIARAYRLAMLKGLPGAVYNVGSGRSIHLAEALGDLLRLCQVPVSVVVDQARLRPSDAPRQQADVSRFTAITGWQPRIAWHTTLSDTLGYWRNRIGSTEAPELAATC